MKDLRDMLEDAVKAVKIDLTTNEKEKLMEELGAFERWLEPLLSVDTAGIEPLRFGHREVNIMREDKPGGGDPERLRRSADNFFDGFYRVPSIIE